MSRNRLLLPAFLAAATMALWAMTGCGGGGGTTSSGTGQIQVSLMDAPLNADEINVEISSVEVHSTASGWTTVATFSPPLPVNLLDYSSSGSSLLLADSPLAAGHYTMVRLMLTSADIVIGGTSYPVDLTNVVQTGVKCNGQFTVGDGELVALILDFNAGKSFVNNPPGSSNFKLHPVMTMSPVNIATEVTGTVEVQTASGDPAEIPENSVIDVYAQGHLGDVQYLISSAVVEADGTFRIGVLPQGTYDFQVVLGDGTTKDLPGTTVTAPATDLGTIVIQLPE